MSLPINVVSKSTRAISIVVLLAVSDVVCSHFNYNGVQNNHKVIKPDNQLRLALKAFALSQSPSDQRPELPVVYVLLV